VAVPGRTYLKWKLFKWLNQKDEAYEIYRTSARKYWISGGAEQKLPFIGPVVDDLMVYLRLEFHQCIMK
jgi:hypothetical protein